MNIQETELMKQLLEAGVHFGHQTKKWNPKMKPYIFGERNGIYIVDLQKTTGLLMKACNFLKDVASKGGNILFVGTKRQSQEIIKTEAMKCNMFYVNQRWLGGLLTNFQTVRKSIKRMKEIEGMKEDGSIKLYSKKEESQLNKELNKLKKNLEGVKNIATLPSAIFIIDAKNEEIAVKEAKKLGIPVVALVDTNSDPDIIDYPIPGNDDAIKSIKLITSLISDSVLEGRTNFAKSSEQIESDKDMEEESHINVDETIVEKLIGADLTEGEGVEKIGKGKKKVKTAADSSLKDRKTKKR